MEERRSVYDGEAEVSVWGSTYFEGRARLTEYVTIMETRTPDTVRLHDGPRRWEGIVTGFAPGALEGLEGQAVGLVLSTSRVGAATLASDDGTISGIGHPPWLPLE